MLENGSDLNIIAASTQSHPAPGGCEPPSARIVGDLLSEEVAQALDQYVAFERATEELHAVHLPLPPSEAAVPAPDFDNEPTWPDYATKAPATAARPRRLPHSAPIVPRPATPLAVLVPGLTPIHAPGPLPSPRPVQPPPPKPEQEVRR